MDNYIQPDRIYGFVKVYSGPHTADFMISESQMAVEYINEKRLLNLWAKSSHYEQHGGHKVYIQDNGFELLMPIDADIDFNRDRNFFHFPVANDAVLNEWEQYYDSTFYQFEHLKIVNCDIEINRMKNDYKVILKGYITDNPETYDKTRFIEAELFTELSDKIITIYNWKYADKGRN